MTHWGDQFGAIGGFASPRIGGGGGGGGGGGSYSPYYYPARTRADEVAAEREKKLGEIVFKEPIGCDAHMEFLYNINGKVCDQEKGFMSAMRSKPEQCPENPNCFADLGQDRRRSKKDEEYLRERLGPPPETLLRGKGEFVGLRNMGSTCYLNSLVQCLYANTNLRQAIYSLPLSGVSSPAVSTSVSSSTAASSSSGSTSAPVVAGAARPSAASSRDQIAADLQFLFARLQDSESKAIRPEDFVQSLAIDPKVQQDAEEFYNLLVTYLEGRFAKLGRPEFIKDELSGIVSYVTQCTCGRVARQRHPFYHLGLSITGCTKLSECLDAYMRPERLDGYRCESCEGRDTSERRVEINRVPPVLNLTLMRFIFDVQRGDKKKLTQEIAFPDELSMQPYVQLDRDAAQQSPADAAAGRKRDKPSRLRKLFGGRGAADESLVYELRAVVAHIGQSAHGGHYISYVLQKETGSWYQFDDAEVSVVKTPPWRQRPVRPAYGGVGYPYVGGMGGAGDEPPIERYETPYMLVYRLKDHAEATPTPPADLRPRVLAESAAIHQSIAHWNAQKPVVLDELKRERQTFDELVRRIAVDPKDSNYFWIATDWLKRWMRDASDIGPIDNSRLLCPHRNVDFRQLNHMKRINPLLWNYLYERYRGGPPLTHDHLCRDCAVHYITQQRDVRDGRMRRERILNEIRPSFPFASSSSAASYYVSAQWLRSFKSGGIAATNGADPCFDIACPHGRLTTHAGHIEKISEKAWLMIIEGYFIDRSPAQPTFRANEEPCPVCAAERQQEESSRKQLLRARADERHPFEAVYNGNKSDCRRIDPKPGVWVPLTRAWLKNWRSYLDKLTDPPGPIDHTELLCAEHGLFKCDWQRELSVSIRKTLFELVPVDLYQRLADFYGETSPAPLVEVLERTLAPGQSRGFRLMYGKPTYNYRAQYPRGYCEPCAETFRIVQREQELHFDREKIFVRFAKGMRGDVELTLSYSTSVDALKYQIHNHFGIPPSQQLLTFENKILTDGVLRDYEVVPPGPIEVERVSSQGFDSGASSAASTSPYPGSFAPVDRPPRREETAFENSALMRASLTNSSHIDNEDDDEENGIRDPPAGDPQQPAPSPTLSSASASQIVVSPPPPTSPAPTISPAVMPTSPPRSPSPQPPRSPRRPGIDFSKPWTCIHCTFENAPSTTGICEICSKTQIKED